MKTEEKNFQGLKESGFRIIALQVVLLAVSIYFFSLQQTLPGICSAVLLLFNILLLFGYMQIEPNDVRVLTFFGKYSGSLKDNGFYWVNPFYTKSTLTQRARNLDVEPIKVNDKAGNPVMIGLVLVWRVNDTYKAMFEIDSSSETGPAKVAKSHGIVNTSVSAARMNALQNFVSIQSDSALRNIAGEYAYDNNEAHDEVTLRSGSQEVADKLEIELNKRLEIAGIEVVEARINYLAYAPEIAAVMLRRQQASAIISAREKIVEGAVGMVQMALEKLAKDNIVELDDDKKAAMVSNLLVVLCSDEQVQPVVNAGTLHQ